MEDLRYTSWIYDPETNSTSIEINSRPDSKFIIPGIFPDSYAISMYRRRQLKKEICLRKLYPPGHDVMSAIKAALKYFNENGFIWHRHKTYMRDYWEK